MEANGILEAIKTGAGCSYGRVNREKIMDNKECNLRLEKTINKIFDKIDEINAKFNWFMVLLILIAIMAGVNIGNMTHHLKLFH